MPFLLNGVAAAALAARLAAAVCMLAAAANLQASMRERAVPDMAAKGLPLVACGDAEGDRLCDTGGRGEVGGTQ